MKIAGSGFASGSESGSISKRHRSEDPDPDPHQNVMDPQDWLPQISVTLVVNKDNNIKLPPAHLLKKYI
jgi:hypothetical protein